MGSSADDRLTRRHTAKIVGKPVDWIDTDSIFNDAAELAEREPMPIRTAIEIVSGKATRSYGQPRLKS